MADDKLHNGEGNPEEDRDFGGDDFGSEGGGFASDSGLGNLPPLSDFESSAGGGGLMDSNLPPLEDIGSDGDQNQPDAPLSGLPPISDIPVETPVPTGGNIKKSPMDFESPSAFDTPTTGSGLDTPQPDKTSFQDLAADSDFTPETPEIGPGPDSDLETPMFDSAFGTPQTPIAGRSPDTSAPTQAMETPMFSADMGFDDGAFGISDSGGFEAGTPVPDFSPDTAPPITGMTPPPPPAGMPMPNIDQMVGPPPAPVKKGKGGLVVTLVVALLCVVLGMAGGLFLWPSLHGVVGLTNPLQADYDATKKNADSLKKQVDELKPKAEQLATIQEKLKAVGGEDADPNKFVETITEKTAEIERLTTEHDTLKASVDTLTKEEANLTESVKTKQEQYVEAEDSYEELLNQISIVRARDNGLHAEVRRLEELVDELESANARRVATKDALKTAAQRLEILVNESTPLAPGEFALDKRQALVKDFQAALDKAQWVTPDLLDSFTKLFLQELEISGARSYFFARIPITDRFGVTYYKWSECLMNGNWSVYYRTLDGKNIGSYENVAQEGVADYQFRELLPQPVKDNIEQSIIASRTPDYEDKVQVLAEKQEIYESKTKFQRVFDSIE